MFGEQAQEFCYHFIQKAMMHPLTIMYKSNVKTRRLQRRSLRLPTRSKSAQTGHLYTTAQAGADPGIFVCKSKFPGLKVGRGS